FMIVVYVIGIWASRKMNQGESFLSDYFLGNRELGGLVLAMTMVATYGSASSFLGGPGAAYSIGLGWVLLSMTQVAIVYFVLLILGKKFAIVTRRFRAVPLFDFLKKDTKALRSFCLLHLVSLSFYFQQWLLSGLVVHI